MTLLRSLFSRQRQSRHPAAITRREEAERARKASENKAAIERQAALAYLDRDRTGEPDLQLETPEIVYERELPSAGTTIAPGYFTTKYAHLMVDDPGTQRAA